MGAPLKPWTHCYKKKFQQLQTTGDQTKTSSKELIFEEKDILQFNQLICSWNVLSKDKKAKNKEGLCKQGFKYSARIRYANSVANPATMHDTNLSQNKQQDKQWSGWLVLAESGPSHHQTFYGITKDGLENKYVRLETPRGKFADAFQIKVEPINGANLEDVILVAASCSNLQKFTAEKLTAQWLTEQRKKLKSVKIDNVPMRSQMFLQHPQAEVLCSPTSLGMLVEYLGKKPVNPVDFADGVYDKGLKVFGSWPCNTAHAFQVLNGRFNVCVERLNSFMELYQFLQNGIPVVVSICGVLEGAPKTNFDGHLLLVVGYDATTQSVICHDPAVGYGLRVSAGSHFTTIPAPKNVCRYYPLKNFLHVWEARQRLAYTAQPADKDA